MKPKQGFTLVEIMIVVAIIGLLAAIAYPSYHKAQVESQKNGCINNLRQIHGAQDLYALEHLGAQTTNLDDLAGPTSYIKKRPFCPGGGTYTLSTGGGDPVCSIVAYEHTI